MTTERKKSRISLAILLAAALVFGSFIAVPEKAYAADVSGIQAGDFIDIGKTDVPGYTGTPHWRVLDKAEDGSLLLMSEYLWRGNGTDATAGVNFVNQGSAKEVNGQVLYWRGTNAEIWCNEFESAILDGVEGLAVKPTKCSDSEFFYTQSLYAEENNKDIHFAAADAVLYENGVFFLSAEEADKYMRDPRTRAAYMPDADSSSQWLLRSSQVSTNWASEVKPDGELAAVTAGTRRAVRPVFWAKFDDGTSFVSMVDESGAKTWTIGEEQTGPEDPAGGGEQNDPGPSDTTVKKVKTITVNAPTVNAKAIDKVIKKKGGSAESVTKIILGSKVKKISPKAFAKYKKLTALEVRTKKLKKKSVKNSLKGSKVKTVKVKVSKKAKTNKKYVKKYKKMFTKKNAGKKVSVKR